jgi:hypothetical protein
MTWNTLTPISLNKDGAWLPLPLAGTGGRVPVRIPSFPIGQEGIYEVGIYDIPQAGELGLVSPAQTVSIARYTRNLIFEVPPTIAAPHIGVRLLTHAELEIKTYSLAIQWQLPYGSGTGNGGGTPVPSGFMAAISWTEIKQAAIAEIAQGYATIESVTTGLAEIQEAVEAIALTPGPKGDKGDPGEIPNISALATKDELEELEGAIINLFLPAFNGQKWYDLVGLLHDKFPALDQGVIDELMSVPDLDYNESPAERYDFVASALSGITGPPLLLEFLENQFNQVAYFAVVGGVQGRISLAQESADSAVRLAKRYAVLIEPGWEYGAFQIPGYPITYGKRFTKTVRPPGASSTGSALLRVVCANGPVLARLKVGAGAFEDRLTSSVGDCSPQRDLPPGGDGVSERKIQTEVYAEASVDLSIFLEIY